MARVIMCMVAIFAVFAVVACGGSKESNNKDTVSGKDVATSSDTIVADTVVADTTHTSGTFKLESSEWKEGQEVPAKYKCNADPVDSPPLSWSGAPAGTKSFIVTVQDLDLTYFEHWAVWNIPASSSSLSAGQSKTITGDPALTDKTTIHGIPFLGPYPPTNENHTYEAKIWALDTDNAVDAGLLTKGFIVDVDYDQLLTDLPGSSHVLGSAKLTVKGGGCP